MPLSLRLIRGKISLNDDNIDIVEEGYTIGPLQSIQTDNKGHAKIQFLDQKTEAKFFAGPPSFPRARTLSAYENHLYYKGRYYERWQVQLESPTPTKPVETPANCQHREGHNMFSERYLILARRPDSLFVALPQVYPTEIAAEDARLRLHDQHHTLVVKLITPTVLHLPEKPTSHASS